MSASFTSTLIPLALAFGCAACTSPPQPICMGTFPASGNPTLAPAGFLLSVGFFDDSACGTPTSLQAGVLGPDNQPVDSGTSLHNWFANVFFTPVAPGRYHVAARFQPDHGLAQVDVEVAESRLDSPARAVTSADTACRPLEITDAGLIVCTGESHPVYSVDPRGIASKVQEFDAGVPLALAGDVLWVGRPLSRWVPTVQGDGTTAFTREPDTDLGRFAVRMFVTPADAVVQLDDGTIGRVRVGLDGGLDFEAYGPVLAAGSDLRRVGEQLVSLGADGECVLELADAGFDCDPKVARDGRTMLDGDATGFWLVGGDGGVLQWHGAGHSVSGPVALPGEKWVLGNSPVPVLRGGGSPIVVVHREGGLGFEYWGDLSSATTSTIVTRGAGKLLFYRR